MTINEAIAKVLTTQYKKDAREAHEIVESAGYTINKYDGNWWVKNPKTDRWVFLTYEWHHKYHGSWLLHTNNSKSDFHEYRTHHRNYKENEPMPINFEKLLATPYNKAWAEVRRKDWNRDMRSEKIIDLKNAKHNVKYNDNALQRVEAEFKKACEKYAREIKYYTENRERDMVRLNNMRKELGLKQKSTV